MSLKRSLVVTMAFVVALVASFANAQDKAAKKTTSEATEEKAPRLTIVEPVKEYRRNQQRPQSMLSPLTGLIDAARPDSDAARRFAATVDGLLSDAPRFEAHSQQLRNTLTQWRNAGPELETIIDRSPALHEARPLAKDLNELGTTGLEALSFISRGVAPSPEWRDARLAALDRAASPKGGLEFPIIPSVRQLVIAASELHQLKQMTPAEWKTQVKTLAALPKSL